MMSGIRGKNTKPELAVRSFLHRAGLRFRLHAKLPGRPDLVLRKHRTAVFVHGCFWHRHQGCVYATTPASNVEYWQARFADNVQRDVRVQQKLEDAGWRVEVVWSCKLSESELAKSACRIKNNSPRESRNGKDR